MIQPPPLPPWPPPSQRMVYQIDAQGLREFPRCSECGGEVRMLPGKGRTRSMIYGEPVAVPDSFKIPTCIDCGEESMTPDVADDLAVVLGASDE